MRLVFCSSSWSFLCRSNIFVCFPQSGKHNLSRALKILVCALGKHPADKLIQVAASATLFYIVKSDEAKMLLGKRMKQLIVSRLLDAMQTFRYDQTVRCDCCCLVRNEHTNMFPSQMLRNGCLNLIHFRIPQDVISEYTRLADILLYIVTNDEEDFVQRLGMYLHCIVLVMSNICDDHHRHRHLSTQLVGMPSGWRAKDDRRRPGCHREDVAADRGALQSQRLRRGHGDRLEHNVECYG